MRYHAIGVEGEAAAVTFGAPVVLEAGAVIAVDECRQDVECEKDAVRG